MREQRRETSKATTTTKSVESIPTPDNSSEEQANSKDKSTPTTAKSAL